MIMILPPLNRKAMNNADTKKAKKYLGQIYTQAFKHITNAVNDLPDHVKNGLIDSCSSKSTTNGTSTEADAALNKVLSEMKELRSKKSSHGDRLLKKKLKLKLKRLKQKQMKKLGANVKKESVPLKPEEELASCSMEFSKLDFTDGETVVSKKKNKFKKDRPQIEKDPENALKRIQKVKERVTNLKGRGDEEKAEEIIQKENWKAAFLKAEGLKVKDNVDLLKKSINKRVKQKKKSTEKWKERTSFVEKKKEEAQKKRKENIMKKKKEKKSKKIKKSIKKGRVVL